MSRSRGHEGARILVVWNELTPYRLHIMRRIADEMPGVSACHFFTHAVKQNTMPWEMEVPPGLDVRSDAENRVPFGTYFHRRWRRLLSSIMQVVDETRPHAVVVAGHGDLVRLALLHRLRRRGIPAIHYSDANVFGISTRSALRDAVRLIYLRAVMRLPTAYMTMGTAGRAYYSLVGVRGRPIFVHPYEPDYAALAVRNPESESNLCRRFGLRAGRRRFLVSGRLVERKRVDVAIGAFASVADRLPEWDLLIAGGGPLEGALRALVPASLQDRVVFTGFLQMDEVRTCYHVSHALVHPSQFEAWALVINEAAACGLPIIASDVTGAAVELVRHHVNGMLVRPGSVVETGRAMLHVAKLGVAERMGPESKRVLAEWRESADPIAGLRQAIDYFADPPADPR